MRKRGISLFLSSSTTKTNSLSHLSSSDAHHVADCNRHVDRRAVDSARSQRSARLPFDSRFEKKRKRGLSFCSQPVDGALQAPPILSLVARIYLFRGRGWA